MTAQPPLPLSMVPAAVPVGLAVSLVEGDRGGEVYIRGQLCDVWDVGDGAARRWAAVKLVRLHAASAAEIAKAFKVSTVALWKWGQLADAGGVAALVAEKKGPKRPSVLVASTIERIVALRGQHRSLRSIAAAVGVSEFSVRRALKIVDEQGIQETASTSSLTRQEGTRRPEQLPLPVLPAPLARGGERAAARAGLLECAEPRFAPAARARHAGLFLALPALETTGLLACAKDTYGSLPDGFYGLETVLIDAVLRALAGEARAEGATRFDPQELGRVLGMDRAPEVKTIRRRISQLAEADKAQDLIAALAKHHLTATGPGGEDLAAILYVDGHVRAYQGTKKIGKIYSTRLKFPVPATEETWVTDAHGSPVFVVMSAPGASLAAELRRLLPELRTAVGDGRRVLVGFDRGGWSPDLFKHMAEKGFDVLTWRKGASKDVQKDLFKEVSHTDGHGEERKWSVADTVVDLSLAATKTTGEVFPIRQVSRIVAATGGGTRQIHILTTDRTMSAGEVVYRMGSRWRQENQFRYARMHFDLDSHDSYTSTGDNEDRLVPEPAKKKAYQKVVAARNAHAEAAAVADANLLALKTPAEGAGEVTVTSAMHNQAMTPVWEAEKALAAAENVHKSIPAKVRLGDLNPGQQVLNTEVKLIHHGIRMAAYNTAMTIAREIRTNTGYRRANQEAHALMRQAFNQPGDIDTSEPGHLVIRLDPLPTKAKTAAIKELCDHLNSTETRYPGTNLILKYTIK
ncbi:transposase [Arthrobacter silviterrae]|uniref:Helix-turn-helix domain-containing protein n=1 Tax=Arthrobacter silviterrae TaxID=2026658 RepID=A0ABX0DFE1_9MICC|nr:helix-turn-helix domain-containing protein [Arthrobacter silviterrae]MDQ0277764.1 transposase [Arthrobacter silviterrae]NGN85564.1 helix-turn-helix domain-containing protein [Arthrobacter silviterrae]